MYQPCFRKQIQETHSENKILRSGQGYQLHKNKTNTWKEPFFSDKTIELKAVLKFNRV